MSNDLKTPQDLIFDFIYVMAMRDATLQKAYEGEKAWLTKRTYYKGWTKELRAFVDNVLNDKINDYDDEFKDLAICICGKINKVAEEKIGKDIREAKYRFTFGNAQKLINMTMKYYYILVYDNDELRKRFEACHCPMDSQLLNNVWDNYFEVFNKKLSSKIGTKTKFLESWGKLDFENDGYPSRYLEFQNAVSELAKKMNYYPIEYDYYEWNNSIEDNDN